MKFRLLLGVKMLHTLMLSVGDLITLSRPLLSRRPDRLSVAPAVSSQGSDSVPSAPRIACLWSAAAPARYRLPTPRFLTPVVDHTADSPPDAPEVVPERLEDLVCMGYHLRGGRLSSPPFPDHSGLSAIPGCPKATCSH